MSGRSAGFWGSHHRRFIPSRPWSATPIWHRTAPGRIGWIWPQSSRLSMTAEADMARARSGTVRTALEPVAVRPHRREGRDIARSQALSNQWRSPAHHGGAADEGHGVARRCARQEGHHDQPRCRPTLSGRQGEPGLRCADAEPAPGFGFQPHVSSWQGMVSFGPVLEPVADRPSPFVIDAFARKIVGWRVSTSMATGFVLDALRPAPSARGPIRG